jgi:hypothetical protein
MVEHGNDGVYLAWVKGSGVVAPEAVSSLAEAADVVPAAVVRGEAKLVKDLGVAGVGQV